MRTTVRGAALACVGALIASLFVLFQAVGGAAAATYPPSTCATVSVSTTTPQIGQSITVTGEDFVANSTVRLYLTPKGDYPSSSNGDAPASSSVLLATVTTDGNGAFTTQVTMPSDAAGNQILSADGAGKICPADPIQIKVSGSGEGTGGSSVPGTGTTTGSSNGGGLAGTGLDVALLAGIAALLLVAGAIFTRGGRRNRHASARH